MKYSCSSGREKNAGPSPRDRGVWVGWCPTCLRSLQVEALTHGHSSGGSATAVVSDEVSWRRRKCCGACLDEMGWLCSIPEIPRLWLSVSSVHYLDSSTRHTICATYWFRLAVLQGCGLQVPAKTLMHECLITDLIIIMLVKRPSLGCSRTVLSVWFFLRAMFSDLLESFCFFSPVFVFCQVWEWLIVLKS